MGVFIGGSTADYSKSMNRDLKQIPMFAATGTHVAIQPGRLSYYFNLTGPSVALDTACSAGLYALNAAVQSIRAGESESAIVAATKLHLCPEDMIAMSMMGLFSEHGKTFAFDHRAKSGFARGEAVGCLVLKPLDQAILDNDRIRSVIVEVGTNQDGKTVGLTTPSSEQQEKLIRQVYARARISPDDTGFVEAHGTGTKVGDPLEVSAIQRVFGNRTKRNPLYIGSVKTNVGHSENVSGLISVIKASLMLERGFILPNVNFEKANPALALDKWHIKVPTTLRPWPRDKRFISVNNFGFGGSNAHVVLERFNNDIATVPIESSSVTPAPRLFVVSGNDDGAAKRVATQLGIYTEQHPEVFQKRLIRDMAYTLGERRTHHPFRLAFAAATCDELCTLLNDPAKIPIHASVDVPKLAFVFTGQGAQWPQMGKELFGIYPIFASTVQSSSDHLDALGADFSLVDELLREKEASIINKPHISQPACTAVQLGLVELLKSWGIQPAAVVGHSSGEIAAAYATGSVTLQDAMAIAYFRGMFASTMQERWPDLKGCMMAVGASALETKTIIARKGLKSVTVACENSPNSTTASGDAQAIAELEVELNQLGTFNRRLHVDVAYHSAHMQLVADDYLSAIRNIDTKASSGVTFYSSLLGDRLGNTSELDASYWVKNLTNPVLFSRALQTLCDAEKPDIIVEIGPHAALEGPIKQILKSMGQNVAANTKYFNALRRNQDSALTAMTLAGSLFTHGQDVSFSNINITLQGQSQPVLVTNFNPYPWSEHKYWCESRAGRQHRFKHFARHDLLGIMDDFCNENEPIWRNVISTDEVPWIKDHKMQSLSTFPLAGYMTMATEAISQVAQLRGMSKNDLDCYRLREVVISKALLMDDSTAYELTTSLSPYGEGTKSYSNDWDEFRISSWCPSRGWFEHCRGLIGVKARGAVANPVRELDLSAALERRAQVNSDLAIPIDMNFFYSELADNGAEYSSNFVLQKGSSWRKAGNLVAADVVVPNTAADMPHQYETPSIVPSAFFDVILQSAFAIVGAGTGDLPHLFMPSAIGELEISTAFPNLPGDHVVAVTEGVCHDRTPGPLDIHIECWHELQDMPVLKLRNFIITPVHGDVFEAQSPRSLCFNVGWEVFNDKKTITPETVKPDSHHEGNHSNGHGNGTNGHTNGHGPIREDSHHNNHTTVSANASPNGRIEDPVADNEQGEFAVHGLVDLGESPIVIICHDTLNSHLIPALVDLIELRSGGSRPSVCSFENVHATAGTRYICMAEVEGPLLHNMSKAAFEKVQSLLLTGSPMLWVTVGAYHSATNPFNNLAQGLLRSVRSETSNPLAVIDLDPTSVLEPADQSGLIVGAFKALLSLPIDGEPVDFEFAEQDGHLVVPRYKELQDVNLDVFRQTSSSGPYKQQFNQPGRRLEIAVATYGALSSLYWKDQDEFNLGPDDIEIKIATTGLNFKDVVIAMGQVTSPYLGVESAGTVTRVGSNVSTLKVGDRVCAMSRGAYGTYTRCPASSAAVVPCDMSFSIAASLPVVFNTAYYGIMELARLKAGESILIHAASGGVGQAAIQLAQLVGARVYATVSSVEKKRFIIDTYGISEQDIFYSRDVSFGPAIRAATDGYGVDVVLNSLAGDLLRETWACLAPFGRFIEIGKRDITSNSRLEMSQFEYNCMFASVDLTRVANDRPETMTHIFNAVMELFATGKIRPIGPIQTVGMSDLEPWLRRLQSGKTMGKVVVDHSLAGEVMATHALPSNDIVKSDAAYIIIGGTGGLGRSITRRLVAGGARHMVLLSRSGAVTAELETLVTESQAVGAKIHIHACDVADETQVQQLISQLQKTLPPIRGVIHAAMVLRDVLFEKMTFEDYEAVVRSKVAGGWNFHTALAAEPLDFFIVLSSVAGIIGNRGQAAYAAANTFLDALTAHRRRLGLASTSIDLTAVEDVGYLADNTAKRDQVMRNISGASMDEDEVLSLVVSAISGNLETTCNGQCITGIHLANGSTLPYYATDGRFTHLRAEALSKLADADSGSSTATVAISKMLEKQTSTEAALDLVSAALGDKLGAILMVHPDVMAAKQNTSTITAFGLDSLNAIELRNWIGKELQAHLQILELLTSGLLRDLAGLVLRKTRIKGVWNAADK